MPNRAANDELRGGCSYVTEAQMQAMRTACRASGRRHAMRDEALVLLMFRHGLRTSEASALRWNAVNLKQGILRIKRSKGSQDGEHPLTREEIKVLRQLRKQYPDSLYLFPGHKGPSISERGIHDVVAQAGREAGLAFPVHPHMLRHGCGYALINKGTDVRVIQSYMGHVSIQSTVRYTHVNHSQFNGLWE